MAGKRRSSGKTAPTSTAKEAVAKVFADFAPDRRFREANEAKVRLSVINAILRAVGWKDADVEVEVPSGAGDFLDYELYAQEQAWMVLEAKRSGATFELSDGTKRSGSHLRSISTLQSQGGAALRDALKQAATYCNDRSIPLACVTNGFQWVFFRGLSSKRQPWTTGQALVFASCDDVVARFDDFFRCLGHSWAGTTHLLELIDTPQTVAIAPPTIPRDFFTPRRAHPSPDRLAVLRSVSDYLLGEIYGEDRRDMLDRCYVTPGVSGDFEHSIERLLKDIPLGLDNEPHDVLGGDPDTFVSTISKQAQLSSIKHPVVVVGHVGVGKTTFLQRSLSKLRNEKSAFCGLVDLEGHGQGGTIEVHAEESRVAQLILDKLAIAATTVLNHHNLSAQEILEADPSEPVTMRTLLRDTLAQERKLGEKVWAIDPAAWDRREYEIISKLRDDPVALLTRFVRHLHGRFKNYPALIVLDNLDQAHDDYQRCIYGFAQRLARDTPAVVVVCIREDTYKIGREEDGFLSSSPLHFVFHVARPPLDKLLRQRVQFGESADDDPSALPRKLRAEAAAVGDVCSLLRQTVLEQQSESLNVFAALAGPNMRDALSLVRGLVEGSPEAAVKPDAGVAYAFECLLISQGHAGLRTRCRIANCFDAEPSDPPLHALRLRLLSYFAWAFDAVAERAFLETTETALGRFASWGYPVALARLTLGELIRDGLLTPIDSTHHDDGHSLPRRLRLSASGYVHLTRLAALPAYRAAMACQTRWYDPEIAKTFIQQAQQAGDSAGVTIGDITVSPALGFFEAYLAASVGREDARLVSALQKQTWTVEVRSRSSAISPSDRKPSEPPPSERARSMPVPAEPERASPSQLNLPLPSPTRSSAVPSGTLPTLRREREYRGTVWIPRILWALEYARRNDLGAHSASDIARTLRRHGELDVPPNNVARAFRDLKGEEAVAGLWRVTAKRYEIEEPGSKLLQAMLDEDEHALEPV